MIKPVYASRPPEPFQTLSALLITVPPMAGLWFNGVMGNYTGYGVFDRSMGVPPGVDGGRSHQQQVESRVASKVEQLDRDYGSNNSPNSTNYQTNNIVRTDWGNGALQNQSSDQLKSQSQMGQSVKATVATNLDKLGNTDNTKNKGEKA